MRIAKRRGDINVVRFQREAHRMKPLANNPRTMPRSGIREIMDLAATVPQVIHLEVGEPDFDTPEHIVDAATKAAREGFTKYTPNRGTLSLRQALVEKLRTDNGIDVSIENVVVTLGGVGGITSAAMVTVEAGDEVLMPDPGWPNYESACMLIGGIPRKYPLDPCMGFLPDLSALEGLVTERTKMLLINSPCNPTGAVFPRETIEALLHFASRHDLYLLSDEVYEHIIFEGEHTSPARLDHDGRVISCFSFSKTYAMTGWRIGYVAASKEIAEVITKLQEPLISCVSGIAQKAGEAALLGPQDCVARMCQSYKKRRDTAVNILQSSNLLTSIPQGAFYILLDISSTGLESYVFAKALLKEQGVAVAPGGAFGEVGKNYVRVSLATEEGKLREGLERLCAFIANTRD
jgi:aspartate/methionine/tyrosine aminotransferase